MQFYCTQKTAFQMTYTIEMVWLRQFIEPGLGVSTYFDFGAKKISTQLPPYGAHILQGLLFSWEKALKLNKNIVYNCYKFFLVYIFVF